MSGAANEGAHSVLPRVIRRDRVRQRTAEKEGQGRDGRTAEDGSSETVRRVRKCQRLAACGAGGVEVGREKLHTVTWFVCRAALELRAVKLEWPTP